MNRSYHVFGFYLMYTFNSNRVRGIIRIVGIQQFSSYILQFCVEHL